MRLEEVIFRARIYGISDMRGVWLTNGWRRSEQE
jgi:hypothetical protein